MSPPGTAAKAEALGQSLLQALNGWRIQQMSLHDTRGEALWLSEGSLGPDEYADVLDAISAFSLDRECQMLLRRLEQQRSLYLAARDPSGACCGVAFARLDGVAVAESSDALPPLVPAIMRRFAMLIAPPASTSATSGAHRAPAMTVVPPTAKPAPAPAPPPKVAVAKPVPAPQPVSAAKPVAAAPATVAVMVKPDPPARAPSPVPAPVPTVVAAPPVAPTPSRAPPAAAPPATSPAAPPASRPTRLPLEATVTAKLSGRPVTAAQANAANATGRHPSPVKAPTARPPTPAKSLPQKPSSQDVGEVWFDPAASSDISNAPLQARRMQRLRSGGATRRYEVVSGVGNLEHDAQLLERVIQWLHVRKPRADGRPEQFFVPISADSATDTELPRKLQALLHRHPLDPNLMGLNLPAEAWRKRPNTIAPLLELCVELGVVVSLSDFWLGETALELLRQKSVRLLKLEPKSVKLAMSERYDRAMLASITQMARVLGLHCVASGDVTAATAKWLASAGIDYVDRVSAELASGSTTSVEILKLAQAS